MVWVIWKKIFCAVIIIGGLVSIQPTRYSIPVYEENNSTKTANYRIEDGASYTKEQIPIKRYKHGIIVVGGTQEIYRDEQGEIVREDENTATYVQINIQGAGMMVGAIFYISSGLELPLTVIKTGLGWIDIPIARNIWLAWVLLGILSAVWIAFSARQRYPGMFPVYYWAGLGFFAPVIVIPFFVQFRPVGDLWPCSKCGKKHLLNLEKCPYC